MADAERFEALIRELGLERPDPAQDAEQEDPRWLAWWLLRMAAATERRRASPLPPVDPELRARFEGLLRSRPPRDEAHAQLHIDPESTLRRALAVHTRVPPDAGPVLAVGDDDAVTVALALLGRRELHAVDVDGRTLDFLERAGRAAGSPIAVTPADVFAEAVPPELRHRCAAAITDPIRSAEGAIAFLLYARAALRRDRPSQLFWADHPDWNFDYARVRETLSGAGLRCTEVLENLHAYPLGEALFPRIDESARVVGLDPADLRDLASRTCAFSHLHVLTTDP